MQERTPRRDAGILQVTERDILALTWIAEQYCLSYDHVQRLLAFFSPVAPKRPDRVAPSTAQNAIERWLHLGYIDMPHKIIREHPTYVWLSRRGLKELALPYAYYQPRPSTIRHIYAVNAIRLHLQRYPLAAEWRSQRSIRLQSEHHPFPDAEFVMNGSPMAAIQVVAYHRLLSVMLHDELATLQALAKRYTRLWYFVHALVLPQLQAALREHDMTMSVPSEQLASSLVWYNLEAQEIPLENTEGDMV